jgi:hypothetical protein
VSDTWTVNNLCLTRTHLFVFPRAEYANNFAEISRSGGGQRGGPGQEGEEAIKQVRIALLEKHIEQGLHIARKHFRRGKRKPANVG